MNDFLKCNKFGRAYYIRGDLDARVIEAGIQKAMNVMMVVLLVMHLRK
ncbi:hypothetical protein [Clostridium estertheticum]|nr:hypothetical protein [Clostridium estertheticum]